MWTPRTPLTITVLVVATTIMIVIANIVHFDWWGLTAATLIVGIIVSLTDRESFYGTPPRQHKPQHGNQRPHATRSPVR